CSARIRDQSTWSSATSSEPATSGHTSAVRNTGNGARSTNGSAASCWSPSDPSRGSSCSMTTSPLTEGRQRRVYKLRVVVDVTEEEPYASRVDAEMVADYFKELDERADHER